MAEKPTRAKHGGNDTLSFRVCKTDYIDMAIWSEVYGEDCEGCIYWSDLTKTCDYMYTTWHRRGCPPGKHCTVKRVEKKKRRDSYGRAYPDEE